MSLAARRAGAALRLGLDGALLRLDFMVQHTGFSTPVFPSAITPMQGSVTGSAIRFNAGEERVSSGGNASSSARAGITSQIEEEIMATQCLAGSTMSNPAITTIGYNR